MAEGIEKTSCGEWYMVGWAGGTQSSRMPKDLISLPRGGHQKGLRREERIRSSSDMSLCAVMVQGYEGSWRPLEKAVAGKDFQGEGEELCGPAASKVVRTIGHSVKGLWNRHPRGMHQVKKHSVKTTC